LKSLDLIRAIELAYDRSTSEEAWLAEITNMVAPAFGGSAVSSFVFDLSDEDIRLGTLTGAGKRDDFERQHEVGRKRGIHRAYDCDMFTLLSRAVGVEEAKESLAAAGLHAGDALGLRANATPKSGIILTTPVRAGHRVRNRELWTRFASHLGAALRLRRLKEAPSVDSAPAILSPTGKLEHGTADAIAAQAPLGRAAKAMDRARGKLRRVDPRAAAALWRTMVQEEWSLVDWYDHDGKRFLLAQENRITARSADALTPRETQVVACAAMGHSNKLIAYDLGLSAGTVAVLLGRAARKLGVSGRVALVRAYKDSYQS
jgi:DNA-binding CsgD family transcriptional regulator